MVKHDCGDIMLSLESVMDRIEIALSRISAPAARLSPGLARVELEDAMTLLCRTLDELRACKECDATKGRKHVG